MPADEVTHGTEVDESRVRTGPRHAAPKKPLFTRFHMPAGKAIALAAMPTAVLMGMGFTPKLALAEDQPASRSLTADEYKDCVAALEEAENGSSESATPSPSASASESPSADEAEPSPSASSDAGSSDSSSSSGSSGSDSSSDSGADDETEPTPSPSASESRESEPAGGATAEPSPSESDKGVLETIGDAVTGVVDTITGAGQETASPTPSPSASASPSASEAPSSGSSGSTEDSGKDTSDPVEETTDKVTDTVEDTVEDATGTASEAAEDAGEAAEEATASPTPSPSASSTTDVDDCPVATDEEGGVDNTVPLPDDPWFLDASSLLLKGADYQGIVKVKTANGSVKEVLKYVISDGTDIGDLHQTVKDEQSGKTYHVQAAEGSTSTIRDGETVMYTERISGNLLGLIPVTFDPEHPPPLNIPLIYFTKVKVQQAGQFGGTLHVPGLHQYVTD
ncbi:hypothetical protein [Streptomyces sp. PSKA30]|uniref:hypothetical protein n=1 Tax=Streptomyces sp. PSKA30 TaxID=2874597 RepID=UPI001CD09DCE|nr:hypothetical protein [Streptomyces sp. PSKA30]MBZ9640236.1 hypothetical protein [Streptomyces sp. PSKA30]